MSIPAPHFENEFIERRHSSRDYKEKRSVPIAPNFEHLMEETEQSTEEFPVPHSSIYGRGLVGLNKMKEQ